MSGKGPRTQLPAGPLDKANMCPQVPILLMTSSSNQRCGPPEGSKPHVPGWLQSPLEDEKILYLMIIHFDYTSALGSMVLFFLQCLGTKHLWVLVSAHQKSVL